MVKCFPFSNSRRFKNTKNSSRTDEKIYLTRSSIMHGVILPREVNADRGQIFPRGMPSACACHRHPLGTKSDRRRYKVSISQVKGSKGTAFFTPAGGRIKFRFGLFFLVKRKKYLKHRFSAPNMKRTQVQHEEVLIILIWFCYFTNHAIGPGSGERVG